MLYLMRLINKIYRIQMEESVVGIFVGKLLVQVVGWVIDVLFNQI